jgi:hypothetical protein
MARRGFSDQWPRIYQFFMFLKINHYIFLENESIFAFTALKFTINYNIEFIFFIVKTEKRREYFSNEQ